MNDTERPIPSLHGERVLIRSIAAADVDRLRAIHATPEVARWWNEPTAEFPADADETETRLTIELDGDVVGMIQFGEEPEPDYRHAWIDLFLGPEHLGRGLGVDAVCTLARHLIDERGHHRITIDPATDNTRAIRCYEKAGFGRVGVMRRAWRNPAGEWRDLLLMELIHDGSNLDAECDTT
jgi:aminoglycoside 6'-N-acetyltransferase